MPKVRQSPQKWTLDEFAKQVVISPSGCWFLPTNKTRAHIISYKLHNGEIPIDQQKGGAMVARFICHKCDTPACCNPEHLFLGFAKDNNADCASKGRTYKPLGVLNVMKRPELRALRVGKGNPMYGRKHTAEAKLRIVAAHTGELSHSKRPEVREKLSSSGKAVKNVICEYCKRGMKPWSYARWHKGKCKGKCNG